MRRPERTSVLVGVVAFITLLAPVHATGQDEITARANQAYQEGDYLIAIEAYEDVLEAGFESGDLYYNLGNAYFKAGDLGRSILSWERALARTPGHPDAAANLALARTLTADAVEPLPRFWLFSVLDWWVELIPRPLLLTILAAGWMALTGGALLRILSRGGRGADVGYWLAVSGAATVLVLGINLVVRELDLGRPDRAVIMAESVPVRSAPAEDDDLTLFEVHEGTRVRIDQRTGEWVEIVLDDGKVGWVRLSVMEEI